MQTSKKLPIGIDNFEKLIKKGYHYVDKTQLLYQLCTQGEYYFLSRPRRFGKSLLLSTIEALYQGKKELFKGLWIEDKWEWSKQNPVIRISFANLDYKEQTLSEALNFQLDRLAEMYGVTFKGTTPKTKFGELLMAIGQERKVVVLIDEYDGPIIDFLTINDARAIEHRSILQNFYLVLKTSGDYLQFVMLTGVSKFSRAGVFSGLNNLNDISKDLDYATLLGYTQDELEADFAVELQTVAQAQGKEMPQLLAETKQWYNGYRFDQEGATVYNPFSIHLFLSKKRFEGFWFETGTPTFLVNLLREKGVYKIEDVHVGPEAFGGFEVGKLNHITLLLQTGYLTIKEMDEDGLFVLDFPNQEVRMAFSKDLLATFSGMDITETPSMVARLRRAFRNHELEEVCELLRAAFASLPYDLTKNSREAFYHATLHLLFTFMDITTHSELHVSTGRLDTVIETQTHIYILEYKLNQPASTALAQIRERGYADRFRSSGKTLVGIGIGFSSQTRNVSDFAWEDL